jgi:isoleucyl-tRNA synthetase
LKLKISVNQNFELDNMNKNIPSSVHLTDFPKYDERLIDKNLEECMLLAQQISSMILALRRKAEKKVRQPLLKAVVPANDAKTFEQIQYVSDLIRNEVNIKELEILLPNVDMENLVKRIKPNFKTLGKRYGKLMKEIANAFETFTIHQISKIEKAETYRFTLPRGEEIELESTDYEIIIEDMPGWLVGNEGNLTVALDVEVTSELENEGVARELVNRIQNIRKSSGYEITDRITVEIERRNEINAAIEEFAEYISNQVLANSLTLAETLADAEELNFDDYIVKVKIRKV